MKKSTSNVEFNSNINIRLVKYIQIKNLIIKVKILVEKSCENQ